MRPIDELIEVSDPVWPDLAAMLETSPRCSLLDVPDADGESTLLALQVSAASALGAIALHSGGVLIDDGWVRLFGGGGALPSLAAANETALSGGDGHGFLEVGVDVLGGRFAINAGALPADEGEIVHWRADELAWSPLGVGYAEFVAAAASEAGLDVLYEDLRWPGWQAEVAAVALDEALSFYPPLCAAESRPLEAASRRAVPRSELSEILADLAGQLS